MQREKLYNLQTKVHFNCILFVSKKKQNSVTSIFAIVKKSLFLHGREFLFLILSFITKYVSFKKTKYTL